MVTSGREGPSLAGKNASRIRLVFGPALHSAWSLTASPARGGFLLDIYPCNLFFCLSLGNPGFRYPWRDDTVPVNSVARGIHIVYHGTS